MNLKWSVWLPLCLGLTLGNSVQDGYGHQVRQTGFSWTAATYLGFLHQYRPNPPTKDSIYTDATT